MVENLKIGPKRGSTTTQKVPKKFTKKLKVENSPENYQKLTGKVAVLIQKKSKTTLLAKQKCLSKTTKTIQKFPKTTKT